MSAGAIGGMGRMIGMGGMGGMGVGSACDARGMGGAVGSAPVAAGNAHPSGVSEVAPSARVCISAAAEKALSTESAKVGAGLPATANVHPGTHTIADTGSINPRLSDFSVVTNLNVNVDIQNINASVDGLSGNRFDDIVAALLIAMMLQQQDKQTSFLSG